MRYRTTFRNKLIERSTTRELHTDTETGHIFHFIRMILQILLPRSGRRHHLIRIRYTYRTAKSLGQTLRIQLGKRPELPDGRILLQDDLPLPVCKYLQRIPLPYPQGPPDFLRDHDPPQIIDPPDNTCCFHIKNPPFYFLTFISFVSRKCSICKMEGFILEHTAFLTTSSEIGYDITIQILHPQELCSFFTGGKHGRHQQKNRPADRGYCQGDLWS